MKNLFILLVLIVLTSCAKEDNKFEYMVTLEDFYSLEPIEGQEVVLKHCTYAGIMAGSKCDSADARVSNGSGELKFTGSTPASLNNHGHKFYMKMGNGYAAVPPVKPEGYISKTTIRVKPLIPIQLRIQTSIEVDSVEILTSAYGYYIIDYKTVPFLDSLNIQVQAVPEEENYVSIYSFLNDTIVGHNQLFYTPLFGENNVLKVVIP